MRSQELDEPAPESPLVDNEPAESIFGSCGVSGRRTTAHPSRLRALWGGL